jgi:catechol 2,3-dioxygenase-like lactoylglutathione lyase family enzyme
MSIQLDHTVVVARDARASAEFLAHVLGLEVGAPVGPFIPVVLANGVTLDFYSAPDPDDGARFAHLAFLVSDDEFDAAHARLEADGVTYYDGPHLNRPGAVNRHDGGKGLYFLDPAGTTMELITVPYGGWPAGRKPG